jgi:hypothetical protein
MIVSTALYISKRASNQQDIMLKCLNELIKSDSGDFSGRFSLTDQRLVGLKRDIFVFVFVRWGGGGGILESYVRY